MHICFNLRQLVKNLNWALGSLKLLFVILRTFHLCHPIRKSFAFSYILSDQWSLRVIQRTTTTRTTKGQPGLCPPFSKVPCHVSECLAMKLLRPRFEHPTFCMQYEFSTCFIIELFCRSPSNFSSSHKEVVLGWTICFSTWNSWSVGSQSEDHYKYKLKMTSTDFRGFFTLMLWYTFKLSNVTVN